jgi:hypothetical protein
VGIVFPGAKILLHLWTFKTRKQTVSSQNTKDENKEIIGADIPINDVRKWKEKGTTCHTKFQNLPRLGNNLLCFKAPPSDQSSVL